MINENNVTTVHHVSCFSDEMRDKRSDKTEWMEKVNQTVHKNSYFSKYKRTVCFKKLDKSKLKYEQ